MGRGTDSYYPHFMDEETETHKGVSVCLFFKISIYLFEREGGQAQAGGRGFRGRGRSKLPAQHGTEDEVFHPRTWRSGPELKAHT